MNNNQPDNQVPPVNNPPTPPTPPTPPNPPAPPENKPPENTQEDLEIDDSFLFSINNKDNPPDDKPPKKDDDPYADLDDDEKVNKRIQDNVKPMMEKQAQLERKLEVDNFLSSNDAKIFTDNIKNFKQKFTEIAQKTEARGIKPEALAHMVAGKQLLKIGAKMAKAADAEAAASATGGGSGARPQENTGMPDVTAMSSKDFAVFSHKVKTGQFKQK